MSDLIDAPAGEPVRLTTKRFIHRDEAGLPEDERSQRIGAAVTNPARFQARLREADDAIREAQEREPLTAYWKSVLFLAIFLSAICSLILIRWGFSLFTN